MKKNWLMAAALACASSMGAAVTVNADEAYRVYSVSDARTAKSIAQAIQDDSASDAVPAAAPAGEAGVACDACAEEAVAEEEECLPCRLFNQDTCSGIKVYGWVNGGLFTNTRATPSRYNGPVTFADRRDGQLNQLYGVIEKTIDTGGCGTDIGGRFDVLYGSDWVYNTQAGWETDQAQNLLNGWNSSPYYGLVTPQAYVEGGYNDLSVKVGRFYTPIGYEVVTAPNNFFATHAYTMQYGEPFSHSGALATYKASDNWTFLGGIVNGWDRFDGITDRASGLGGAIYTPDHGEYTITVTGISGSEPAFDQPNPADPGLFTTRSMYSVVFNWTVTEKLNYVLQHDNGWQDGTFAAPTAPPGAGRGDAEWYGINQYLFYTINDCWKAGIRGEWFRDDDGVRVVGVRPTNGADAGNNVATPGGYAGNFYEVSLGLNWTPHANLIVRPEVRYDWYDGEQLLGAAPFGDGNESSQWVYGLDAVVLW